MIRIKIKGLLAAIWCLLYITAGTHAQTVLIPWETLQRTPMAGRVTLVLPWPTDITGAPMANIDGNAAVGSDQVRITNDATGLCTITNCVPGYYVATVQGAFQGTPLYFQVTNGTPTNATVYAGQNLWTNFPSAALPSAYIGSVLAGMNTSIATNLVGGLLQLVINALGGNDTNALHGTNNLSDVQSASAARTNLGLGTAATNPASAFQAAGAAAGGALAGTYPNPTLANSTLNALATNNGASLTNLPRVMTAVGELSGYRIEKLIVASAGGATGIHPYLTSVLSLNGIINYYFTSWSNGISGAGTNYARQYVKRGRTWEEVVTNTATLVFTTNQAGAGSSQFYVAGAYVYSENGTNVWDYFSGTSGGFESSSGMTENEAYTVDGTNFINGPNNPTTSLAGGTWHSSFIYYGPIVKDRNGLYHRYPAANNGAWESSGHQTAPTMFGPWTDLSTTFMPLGPTNTQGAIVNDLVCIWQKRNGTYAAIGRGVGTPFPGGSGGTSVLTGYTSPDLTNWTYIGVVSVIDDTGTFKLTGSLFGIYGPNVFDNAAQPWMSADDDFGTGAYIFAPASTISPILTTASNNAVLAINALVPGLALTVISNSFSLNTNVVIANGFTTSTLYNGISFNFNSTLGSYTNSTMSGVGVVLNGNPQLAAFNASLGSSVTIALTNAANNFLGLPEFVYTTGDGNYGPGGWYDFNGVAQPLGAITYQIQGGFSGDGGNLTNLNKSANGIAPTASPTFSGTVTFPNQNSNLFFAGPKNNGAAAAPTFRGLDISDFNSGTSASSTTYWRGDGTWATPAGGSSSNYTVLATGTLQATNLSRTGAFCLTNPGLTGGTLVSNVMSGVTCATNPGNCDAIQLWTINVGSTSTANSEVAHVYFNNTNLPPPVAIIYSQLGPTNPLIAPARGWYFTNFSPVGYSVMNGASGVTANSIFQGAFIPVRQ